MVLCIAICIARAHVHHHVVWLLEFMRIYMRACSWFTAILTVSVSDSVVSLLGAGCWVLAVLNTLSLIEHRPFHTYTRDVIVHSIQ